MFKKLIDINEILSLIIKDNELGYKINNLVYLDNGSNKVVNKIFFKCTKSNKLNIWPNWYFYLNQIANSKNFFNSLKVNVLVIQK